MNPEAKMTVTIQKEFTHQQISDLLCGAFEGGSNYWYNIRDYIYPAGAKPNDFDIKYIQLPLTRGGGVVIEDIEDSDTFATLNLESIQKGLQIMAKDYPRHFNDFVTENHDATTSDVFLQVCLFGKVVFG